MTTIRLDHLTKTFCGSTTPVVHDVSLDIADGEFVVLVGPSGSGKSTILRMIVGLEDITSGEVFLGDKKVNDKAPRDRNMAMVFQSYALYPHLNVFENIAFPLRLHKVSHDEVRSRVREAADLLELEAFLDRKPSQLSGGQRQRAAMGRAIVRQPDAFSSTSRCRTSTPSCAARRGPRSRASNTGSASPPSTSSMTRSKP